MYLKQTARWAIASVMKTLGPKSYRSDYLVLTPPFLRKQLVLNKRTRRVRGYKVRDDVDAAVLHQIFLDEHYRLDRLARAKCIFAKYDEIMARGAKPLIIDCGANIGLSAAYLAEQFPAAKIVAVEPQHENVVQGRGNCPAVEFVEAAVASECGNGSLVDPGRGSWGFQVKSDPLGRIRFVSINELLEQRPDCEPFLIKIDIEGFEKNLFAKNLDWIDRFFVMIVELHDWMLPMQRTSHNFLKAIAGRDRDFVHIGENIFSISNS